jgi:hypothetical protein
MNIPDEHIHYIRDEATKAIEVFQEQLSALEAGRKMWSHSVGSPPVDTTDFWKAKLKEFISTQQWLLDNFKTADKS